MQSIVVLLILAVMASLIPERILRVQWAHRVNISWTTGVYCFPQGLMPWTTKLYKLQHMHFGKGGDGVWLPKGRGSKLMREGLTSTYYFPPAGKKALHLFSKCRNLQWLHPPLFCCFSWKCIFTLPPWGNQMFPGLCESPPEKFIGLVTGIISDFFTTHLSSPVVGHFFFCTFGNICVSPPALWPG